MIAQGFISNRRASIAISIATIAIAAVLIFARLGHYALWDDESLDALLARGVKATGVPTAVIGKNIIAYRHGLLLVNMRPQAMPPLPSYLVADSFAIFGESSWSARLPFALCGCLCIALMMWWALQLKLRWEMYLILGLAIIGNISLLLYFRNCRYYAPGILANVIIAYIYLRYLKNHVAQIGLALISGLLMLDNYSWFVILYSCLFVDYVIWRRKECVLGWQDLCRLLLPQIPFGLLVLWKFNPLGTGLGGYLATNTFNERLILLWWNIRDLNRCEFLPLGLIIAALFWWRYLGSKWLLRSLVVLALYIILVTFLSIQLLSMTTVADIRYLAGSIPLCIAISVMIIAGIFRYSKAGAILIAVIAFGTNLLNGGPFLPGGFRSTFADFAGELMHPPGDPYEVASKWVNENVPKGASVWVAPDYMTYPLMFHAPNAIYAWQLEWPPKPQFANLDPIHFQGVIPPDFIVIFGPTISEFRPMLAQWGKNGTQYVEVAQLDHFWKDLHRPELMWRTFKPITNYDKGSQAIYIFKRTAPPSGTTFPRPQ